MKNQEQYIKGKIAEYDAIIADRETQIEKYKGVMDMIKKKHGGSSKGLETNVEYQQMKKDINLCNGEILAYTQAKVDMGKVLDYEPEIKP